MQVCSTWAVIFEMEPPLFLLMKLACISLCSVMLKQIVGANSWAWRICVFQKSEGELGVGIQLYTIAAAVGRGSMVKEEQWLRQIYQENIFMITTPGGRAIIFIWRMLKLNEPQTCSNTHKMSLCLMISEIVLIAIMWGRKLQDHKWARGTEHRLKICCWQELSLILILCAVL